IVDGSPYKMEVDEDSEGQLYRKIGGKTTLYQLIYDMITYSSNLATNILIELANAKKVTQTLREIGAKNIQVLRGVEDQKAYDLGLNNKVTARDLMLIFEKLGEGKW
ncbi:MAG: serine hydrolase, partial [bacterium]